MKSAIVFGWSACLCLGVGGTFPVAADEISNREYLERVDAIRKKVDHLSNPKLKTAAFQKEVFALLGSPEKTMVRLRSMLHSEEYRTTRRAAFLVSEMIPASLDLGPEIGLLEKAGRLIEKTNDPNPMTERIAGALFKLDKLPPLLLEQYLSQREHENAWACIVLRRVPSHASQFLPEMISVIADSRATDERVLRTCQILRSMGAPAGEAADPLVQVLGDGKRGSEVKDAAGRALAAIGPAAVPELLAQLESQQSDLLVRTLAVLGSIGPEAKSAASRVVPLFSHKSFRVRFSAARSYWYITQSKSPSIEIVGEALNHPEFRSQAVRDISNMEEHCLPILGPIIRQLGKEGFPESEKASLIRTLGRIGPPARQALPVLTLLCSSESCYLRRLAAYSLYQVSQDPELPVQALLSIIEEEAQLPPTGHSRVAIYSLRLMGAAARKSIPTLEECLLQRTGYIRSFSAYALAEIGGEGIPILRQAVQSDHPEIRKCALRALQRYNAKKTGQ